MHSKAQNHLGKYLISISNKKDGPQKKLKSIFWDQPQKILKNRTRILNGLIRIFEKLF